MKNLSNLGRSEELGFVIERKRMSSIIFCQTTRHHSVPVRGKNLLISLVILYFDSRPKSILIDLCVGPSSIDHHCPLSSFQLCLRRVWPERTELHLLTLSISSAYVLFTALSFSMLHLASQTALTSSFLPPYLIPASQSQGEFWFSDLILLCLHTDSR